MKMAVLDGRQGLIALLDPVITKPTWTSVVFDHAGMAEAMKGLFEDYWRRAQRRSWTHGRSDGRATRRRRQPVARGISFTKSSQLRNSSACRPAARAPATFSGRSSRNSACSGVDAQAADRRAHKLRAAASRAFSS